MRIRPRIAPRRSSPLARSHLKVDIADLIAEYELRHVFRNDGTAPIEAVYSFPVPLDAAFLGMEATLGGETLHSQVQPKADASRRYDNAVAGGDSAVLLEAVEPGMLCVNLGNLLPKEEGEIVLRFAAALGVADRVARFSLPLVHRPRYGRSKLDHLVEPQYDFAVEHPLDVEIRVRGLLATAAVQCAAHGVRFERDGDAMLLHIGHTMLDRDFVLSFELPKDVTTQARLIADGDDTIGLVTFTIPPQAADGGALDLSLVLDGSGSMEGDAIAQSRLALKAVSSALGDTDRVQVLRFGSRVEPLFRRPLLATARVREALHTLVDTVKADLGGTEIGAALNAAMDGLENADTARTRAIVLVTDGAVTPKEIEEAQARAVKLGIRIFVVAVGSSAGVDVLAPLAAATHAVLERAVPAEPVDAGVMRQFRRARTPAPPALRVDWGTKTARTLRPGVAYPGDATMAIAFLHDAPPTEVAVRIAQQDSLLHIASTSVETRPSWRAWAGQQAYRAASGKQRAALALRYGLITDETSAVLVKARAEVEKANGLPQVVPIAHMVPDGTLAYSRSSRLFAASATPAFDRVAPRGDLAFCLRNTDDNAEESAKPSPYKTNNSPRKPLSEDRIAEIRLVLRNSLERLLLGVTTEPCGLEDILHLIKPSLHDDVLQYLIDSKQDLHTVEGACDLLHDLACAGVGRPLTDEQEARLAVARFVSG